MENARTATQAVTAMKSPRLNKKELAIALEAERKLIAAGHKFRLYDGTANDGLCYVTGQRATLYEPRLMYHEGYIKKDRELMHHAWNTLNGKLVDIQSPCDFRYMHLCTEFYLVDKSYTAEQVRMAMLTRGGWDWMDKAAPATVPLCIGAQRRKT